ncbi:MAG: tetratricopeptide (TPR) repeat protein [Arenicella sp.]|jgi:tetratricopeptide (TPR) repeat protein
MDKRLLLMGHSVDLACDSSNQDDLLKLVEEFDKLAPELCSTDQLLAYYFQSNAYAELDEISQHDEDYFLSWEREYLGLKLSSLRKAKRHNSFQKLDKTRQCQILTNTGIALNSLGRSIDAIEQFNLALEIIPDFAMALSARSSAYEYYAGTTSDPGHVAIIML